MDTEALIDLLDEEGTRLVACANGELSRPVSTCAPWTLRELLAHLGGVHRWATRQILSRSDAPVGRESEAEILASAPADADMARFVRDGHGQLVDALRDAPADLSCWTFLPAPSPRAFWARRQLHETTIHRVDAELALGRTPAPIATATAQDGLDEVLYGFHARPQRTPPEPGLPAAAIRFVATDAPAAFGVRLESDRLVRLADADSADVEVRGTAAALYLTAWNRPAEITVRGDAGVLERYARRCRIVRR